MSTHKDKDILSLEDINRLVHVFYDKVRADALLGPVFQERIRDEWPQHLEKMVRFWQTVLLQEHTYLGSPFPHHARLPIDHRHFGQWMALFTKTVDEEFTGERAEEAKWRAGKMAEIFEYKIEQYKTKGTQFLS